jgi:hypothetical protein
VDECKPLPHGRDVVSVKGRGAISGVGVSCVGDACERSQRVRTRGWCSPGQGHRMSRNSRKHNTGGRARPWCLVIHAEASALALALSRGTGRKPGASFYTQKRLSLALSLTGDSAKALCLLMQAEASLSHALTVARGPGRTPGASLCTQKRLTLSNSRNEGKEDRLITWRAYAPYQREQEDGLHHRGGGTGRTGDVEPARVGTGEGAAVSGCSLTGVEVARGVGRER